MLLAAFGEEGGIVSGQTEPVDTSALRPRTFALAPFQEAGVARVRRALDRRGGVILADAVGLGKTYMALAVAEERLRAGGDVVVIVPAALRTVWASPLARIARAAGRAAACRILSHTQLSRGAAVPPTAGTRLIIVDEAHRFRNPDTLRYRALARTAIGGHGVGARTVPAPARPQLLLVTATPVNNALVDLYHLVRLFLPDDGLRGVGVPSMRAVFDADPPDPAGLRILVRELVVRRSRPMVERRYGEIRGPPAAPAAGGPSRDATVAASTDRPVRYVRFPKRAPPRIHGYVDPAVGSRVAAIDSLELVLYGDRAGPLVRLALLKRMDSSSAAFTISLHRLLGSLDAFIDAARAGRLLRPGDRPVRGDGDPLQLPLPGVIADPAPPDVDLVALAASAAADRRTVEALLRGSSGSGAKAGALLELLESVAEERVLVFTEYRDTAESLWRTLAGRVRVGRIDGSGAWLGAHPAGRRAVVERFAPEANRRPPPSARERVHVLVATDVLAEGLNLQDARHVVSYDLPWNPVRLLQRIGRVDRLGSPHDEVVPHLFVPAHGLDEVLGLTRRLRTKLHGISTVLDEPQADDLLHGLAAGRPNRVEAAMRAIEDRDGGDPWERLRTLWLTTGRGGAPDGYTAGPGTASDPSWAELDTASRHDSTLAAGIDRTADRLRAVVLLDDEGRGRRGGRRVQLLEVTASGEVRPLGDAGADALAGALADSARPADVADGAAPERGGRSSDQTVAAGGVPPHRLRPVMAAVARHRSLLAARGRAPAAISPRDAAARMARRIRRALADAGAGLSPGVTRDAERVLGALSEPLPPTAERALARLVERDAPDHRLAGTRSAADDPTGLVACALDVLRSHGVAPAPAGDPDDPVAPRVRAVLLTAPKAG